MWRAERTEQLHRHLMQITEDRSGALEPRGDLVDPASGIVGQGRARRLRVNNDRVLSEDRKSTRLNSSHPSISYAVFCLKKKNDSASKTRAKRAAAALLACPRRIALPPWR